MHTYMNNNELELDLLRESTAFLVVMQHWKEKSKRVERERAALNETTHRYTCSTCELDIISNDGKHLIIRIFIP